LSCAGARDSLEAIAAVSYSRVTGIARNTNRRYLVKKNEKIEKAAREIKNQSLDKVRGAATVSPRKVNHPIKTYSL
jgi:hypothetical protein